MTQAPRTTADATAELYMRMPWLNPEPNSIWEISGKITGRYEFLDLLAVAVTGMESDQPTMYELVGGPHDLVATHEIVYARECVLVYANAPRQAVFDRDQHVIDAGTS